MKNIFILKLDEYQELTFKLEDVNEVKLEKLSINEPEIEYFYTLEIIDHDNATIAKLRISDNEVENIYNNVYLKLLNSWDSYLSTVKGSQN